jgi:site-specific recombinase XerD
MAAVTPTVTIYVRHSAGCKYSSDEFAKRCECRKWLRWTPKGSPRQRRPAETRSWAEAEQVKRDLEDHLSGRTAAQDASSKSLASCIDVFLQDKRVQGVADDTIGKYTRELNRLRKHCDGLGVSTVQGVTRELLTGYCATWETLYPSSVTRSKARERCRAFLRYCYEAQWLPRIPTMSKIKVDEIPTMPLSSEEFQHLLDSIPAGLPHAQAANKRVRVRALFLLMRWSGLAISDALCLKRTDLTKDRRGVYRVVTSRQKTGTHVSVPLPTVVAKEILNVPNANPKYLFWSGNSAHGNHATKWQTRYVAPVFKAAGLHGTGHMVSHRLRDTFAVDLLQKGVPMEEVSKLLGHTSIKTTERSYAKWVQSRQDRLDSLVTATWAA